MQKVSQGQTITWTFQSGVAVQQPQGAPPRAYLRPCSPLARVFVVFLGLVMLGSLACRGNHGGSQPLAEPLLSITPGWTIPAAPAATVGQDCTASVPAVAGASYLWSVLSGTATLIHPTASEVTFTPTVPGPITLQVAVTDASHKTITATYVVIAGAGAVLNAEPATITLGQGTILLATFTGSGGTIMPGSLAVTSEQGVAVKPTTSTTYTLSVNGAAVATATVNVLKSVPKFVYVSNGGDSIDAFRLDAATGALTGVSHSPYPCSSDQIVASTDGRFLFAAGTGDSVMGAQLGDGVYGFSIDPSTGALAPVPGSPIAADSVTSFSVFNLAIDPYNRFLYTSGDSGVVHGYTVDPATGALAEIGGSPWATGPNYRGGVLVHPSGRFLYTTASGTGYIHGFSIDQSTGALHGLDDSPYDARGGGLVASPYGLAVDSTGAYLFTKGEAASTNDSQYLASFRVNAATGGLTALPSSPIGPFPGRSAFHGLCFHPTLDVLYTAFYGSDDYDLGAFTLDLGTGALAHMTGSPYSLFPDQHGSDNVVVDRSGSFAFSTSFDNYAISRMRVDATGLLTKLDGSPLGSNDVATTMTSCMPVCVVVAGTLEALPQP